MFECSKCRQQVDSALKLPRRKTCRTCYLAQLKAYKARNRGAVAAYNRSYREKNQIQINGWRSQNRDKVNPVQNAWRDQHRDQVRDRARARHKERMQTDMVYAERVKLWMQAVRALRKRARLAPVARFFAAEIRAFYAARPSGLHVDHIEPLLGKTACGLHVPWNLQYLPHALNQQKSNKGG